MTLEKWMLFATVWTFAALPIGPNALNCIQTSVAVGFRKSLWSVIGILIASVVFMSIVFSGVAVLLQTNDFIFFLIQLIGASYLFWLGIKMFYNSSKLTISEIDVNLSNTAIVRSAF